MKKQIIIGTLLIAIVAIFSFKPAVVAMQFQTLGVNIYQVPTQDTSGKWHTHFVAWYGVVGNPYTLKVGSEYKWGQWVDLKMVTNTTDASTMIQVATDSANAYRVRNFPNVQ